MIKKVVATAAAAGGLLLTGAGVAAADAQVNACGNTVTVLGLLNGAYGNTCVNHD